MVILQGQKADFKESIPFSDPNLSNPPQTIKGATVQWLARHAGDQAKAVTMGSAPSQARVKNCFRCF